MNNVNYDSLVEHPFVKLVFKKGMEVKMAIERPNSFKVKAIYEREPTEEEFYCLQVGFSMTHALIVVRQLEHTILYMSNFSPSEKMKKAEVNRYTHLLWSIENYIIRTHSVYDRVLILTDRLFHIQNNPNRISHDSIITNLHISSTKIPILLKPLKSSIKKYYHNRNTIIHESSYADDDLRRIEAYSILSNSDDYAEFGIDDYKEELKWSTKEFLKKKKREFTRINGNISLALIDLFTEMHPIYITKYEQLLAKNC